MLVAAHADDDATLIKIIRARLQLVYFTRLIIDIGDNVQIDMNENNEEKKKKRINEDYWFRSIRLTQAINVFFLF